MDLIRTNPERMSSVTHSTVTDPAAGKARGPSGEKSEGTTGPVMSSHFWGSEFLEKDQWGVFLTRILGSAQQVRSMKPEDLRPQPLGAGRGSCMLSGSRALSLPLANRWSQANESSLSLSFFICQGDTEMEFTS